MENLGEIGMNQNEVLAYIGALQLRIAGLERQLVKAIELVRQYEAEGKEIKAQAKEQ